MAEYWVGPSLRQDRRRQWMAPERRASGQSRRAERRVARPLTPRRWRAFVRLANVKAHDVTFLARYAAHAAVLVLTCAVGLLHGTDFSQLLQPRQVYTQAPQTMVWASGSDDQATYLRWGALPQTVIPEHPAAVRYAPMAYEVQPGDNPPIIAARFGLQPSTIVWANAGEENPDLLAVGQQLVIPPVDGVLHTVEPGDTLTALATTYSVDVNTVVGYQGNNLADAGEVLMVGQQVMVPGGVVPLAAPTPPPPPPPPAPVVRPAAPVAVAPAAPAAPAASSNTSRPATTSAPAPAAAAPSASTSRPATTSASASTTTSTNNGYVGAVGCCVWPTRGRITQNPWSQHMALDIAAPIGTPVYAADGGKVVWSGWDNTGYGYMIIIDHGNGLRTRYAHHSYLNVSYGDYVNRGALIGRVGSTGNSTGPHLHFEVIRNGYRQNPYNWLP